MSVEKKIAYLKGLTEGLNISDATSEGKVLLAIIDALELISDDLAVKSDEIEQLNDYVEEVDNDLMQVEEFLDEECDECDCDDCDCDCDNCDCDCDCDDLEYEEYECPQCHEVVSFSGDFDESEMLCPNCGAKVTE